MIKDQCKPDEIDEKLEFVREFSSAKVIDGGGCVVNALEGFYAEIRDRCCGKCVLCREGSLQLAAIFSDIAKGRAKRNDITLIEDICPIIREGSQYTFGREMVLPALEAASQYRDELEKHVIGRTCPAGKCSGLLKYIIDPALCAGCGQCMESCPEEAIDGRDGFIHIIDENQCEKCGDCVSLCNAGAIKSDGGNIKTPKKPIRVGRFNQ